MIPEDIAPAVDAVFPPEATSIGFLPLNTAGQLLMLEPAGHFAGVNVTFPKTRLKAGERPSDALVRCLKGKAGATVFSVFPIHHLWKTSNSTTFYFAGLALGDELTQPTSSYAAHAAWFDVDTVQRELERSPNKESRSRDLGVMQAALSMCLFPGRQLLLMIGELHRRGFERLRAAPYMSPSGACWRCEVVPITCTSPKHGACPRDTAHLQNCIGRDDVVFRYSTGDGQRYFHWDDAAFDTPSDLADKFLQRSREVAFAGWGHDTGYVRWFDEMLALTAPNGVPYAFADFQSPTTYLYTALTPTDQRISLPPPGLALWSDDDKWMDF